MSVTGAGQGVQGWQWGSEIPTLKIGKRLFVPIGQLEGMMSPTIQDTEIKNGDQ
jgi:hypothetical protein